MRLMLIFRPLSASLAAYPFLTCLSVCLLLARAFQELNEYAKQQNYFLLLFQTLKVFRDRVLNVIPRFVYPIVVFVVIQVLLYAVLRSMRGNRGDLPDSTWLIIQSSIESLFEEASEYCMATPLQSIFTSSTSVNAPIGNELSSIDTVSIAPLAVSVIKTAVRTDVLASGHSEVISKNGVQVLGMQSNHNMQIPLTSFSSLSRIPVGAPTCKELACMATVACDPPAVPIINTDDEGNDVPNASFLELPISRTEEGHSAQSRFVLNRGETAICLQTNRQTLAARNQARTASSVCPPKSFPASVSSTLAGDPVCKELACIPAVSGDAIGVSVVKEVVRSKVVLGATCSEFAIIRCKNEHPAEGRSVVTHGKPTLSFHTTVSSRSPCHKTSNQVACVASAAGNAVSASIFHGTKGDNFVPSAPCVDLAIHCDENRRLPEGRPVLRPEERSLSFPLGEPGLPSQTKEMSCASGWTSKRMSLSKSSVSSMSISPPTCKQLACTGNIESGPFPISNINRTDDAKVFRSAPCLALTISSSEKRHLGESRAFISSEQPVPPLTKGRAIARGKEGLTSKTLAPLGSSKSSISIGASKRDFDNMVTPRADPLALSVYNADDGAKLLPNAPCLELAISTTQPAHLAHNGPIISHGKPAETLQTKKDTLAIVKQGCMSNALVRKTRTQKKSPSRICPLSEQRIYLLAEEEGKRMVYTTALLKSPRHREKEIFSAFVDHTWAKIRGHHPPSVHSAALVHVS